MTRTTTTFATVTLLLALSSLSVVPIVGFSIPATIKGVREKSAATRGASSSSRSTMLHSSPGDTGNSDKEEEEIVREVDEAPPSLWDKVNNFLDTPILDANNRSDQGAVAETLKEFVRDEPEIAQVTFSAVVVAIMVLVTRLVMSS
mmetsp:Transcript_29372/g.79515  ORF Transcript_29372/g.79515 Transcript_29372/m.79515 type:complete len:146 (+) Transcript_29372:136-573(+)|eukprot:CAMPEP_0172357916 /NCGR_PEP_ID=MMETSP1060-20121228/2250_1 /TAXON_ID=37318 /ORGANISM="Pseudo-nitzschia pungens, Strain cf. cingulata" /LENGTH=145 /DNA_ID=CAMNT_0013078851 /DNA_START=46 /DNA_END=483 /DNA_ORIENTATION=+